MTLSASGTEAINNISSQYKPRETKTDPMGKDAFMTMLIAQLKNQDPLNPLDGTDFTAQLAQFTQLEKSMSMDSTLTKILNSMDSGSQGNYVDHIGKTVSGNLNTVSVNEGEADTGYFTLKEPGEVVLAVYDSNGAEVKRIFLGQQNAGTNSFQWDGKNTDEKLVSDGSYTYDAFVLGPGGYSKLNTGITGEVTGLTYKNGKQLLEVSLNGGTKTILMDPSAITKVTKTVTAANVATATSSQEDVSETNTLQG